LEDARERMKPLITDKSRCENPPRIPEKILWLKPKLVGEVSFAEWTQASSRTEAARMVRPEVELSAIFSLYPEELPRIARDPLAEKKVDLLK